jgi:hypothetical protein
LSFVSFTNDFLIPANGLLLSDGVLCGKDAYQRYRGSDVAQVMAPFILAEEPRAKARRDPDPDVKNFMKDLDPKSVA